MQQRRCTTAAAELTGAIPDLSVIETPLHPTRVGAHAYERYIFCDAIHVEHENSTPISSKQIESRVHVLCPFVPSKPSLLVKTFKFKFRPRASPRITVTVGEDFQLQGFKGARAVAQSCRAFWLYIRKSCNDVGGWMVYAVSFLCLGPWQLHITPTIPCAPGIGSLAVLAEKPPIMPLHLVKT